MGLLSRGSPMSWEETKRYADHVRRHGILQFLHIYHAVKDRHKDVLKWGDEVSAATPDPPGLPCQVTLRCLCSARPYLRPCPGPHGCPRPVLRPRLPGRLPAAGRRPCPLPLPLGVQGGLGRGALL